MLGWPTDVLKATVSLLTLRPWQFLTPGPAVQVLEARSNRAWRTLLSDRREVAREKHRLAPDRGIRARSKPSEFLACARAARRVPDVKAACFAMLTLVPECVLAT